MAGVITNKSWKAALEDYQLNRLAKGSKAICHAPFSSMYLRENGEVAACCYNRKGPLGFWGTSTLKEIWFSETAMAFRQQMLTNALPEGCEPCAVQLLAKNFSGIHAGMFDTLDGVNIQKNNQLDRLDKPILGFPEMLELELSNECNLECVMCSGVLSSSIRKNREKLPARLLKYDSRLAEQLAEFIPHLKHIKFLGGEPFLIKLYAPIWDLIYELNPTVQINITTNATIMNERVRTVVKDLNTDIVISTESLIKDTYESIRINAHFDTFYKNLLEFIAMGKTYNHRVSLAVCPLVQNRKEIPDIIEFCNEQQIPIYLNTVTDSPDCSLRYLPAHIIEETLNYYEAYKPKVESLVAKKNMAALTGLIQQLNYWRQEALDNRADSFINTSAPNAQLVTYTNDQIDSLELNIAESLFKQQPLNSLLKTYPYLSSYSGYAEPVKNLFAKHSAFHVLAAYRCIVKKIAAVEFNFTPEHLFKIDWFFDYVVNLTTIDVFMENLSAATPNDVVAYIHKLPNSKDSVTRVLKLQFHEFF